MVREGYTAVSLQSSDIELIDEIADEMNVESRPECVRVLLSLFESIQSDRRLRLDSALGTGDHSVDLTIVTDSGDGETARTQIGDYSHVGILDDSVAQPMYVTSADSGEFFCPVCESVIGDFEFADRWNAIGNAFRQFSVECTNCECFRGIESLFVLDDGASIEADYEGLFLYRYWPWLFLEELNQNEITFYAEYLSRCVDIVDELDWEWLPSPSVWLQCDLLRDAVTPIQYMNFFASYVWALGKHNSVMFDSAYIGGANCEQPQCAYDTNHIHISGIDADPLQLFELIEGQTSSWSDVSVVYSVEDAVIELQELNTLISELYD